MSLFEDYYLERVGPSNVLVNMDDLEPYPYVDFDDLNINPHYYAYYSIAERRYLEEENVALSLRNFPPSPRQDRPFLLQDHAQSIALNEAETLGAAIVPSDHPGNSDPPQHDPRKEAGTLDADITHSDCLRNVHMFSNAESVSIRDATINNAGGDINVVHNHVYPNPESSPSSLLSQCSHLLSEDRLYMFHTAEIVKSILPTRVLTSPEIHPESAEAPFKSPLLNVKILLSKISMRILGFIIQMSSFRYSFF